MVIPSEESEDRGRNRRRDFPPGRMKITRALKELLAEKEFHAVTTAEIARSAGVNESLIYKYFADKRDLLHAVLEEYLDHYVTEALRDLEGATGSLNRLRRMVRSHLGMYADDRTFAKILLLEVRNDPGYFRSAAYGVVRRYAGILMTVLEEGVAEGEIRNDVSCEILRQVVLGAIEHACLPNIIFKKRIDVDELADSVYAAVLTGIQRPSMD